ncbi:MAG: RCC1 domain-containing protein [Tepidimonas sp.]
MTRTGYWEWRGPTTPSPARSLGERHTLAIRSDGTLFSWGDNVLGQLGDGTTASQRGIPTRIGDATDWLRIHAGAETSYSIRTDGTLWSWGRNHKGQLGLGDLITRRAPARVA